MIRRSPQGGGADRERRRPSATNRRGSGNDRLAPASIKKKKEKEPNRLPALLFSSSSAPTQKKSTSSISGDRPPQLNWSDVCRKWRALTSDDELWRKLFSDRWGADAAAFYAPEGSKTWKDVFVVQDRCDRYGLGVRIIREGKDYYLIYQGEIQRYLGSRQDTDAAGKDAPRHDAEHEQQQISNRILFFLGDLEAACADAKRVKA